MPHALPSELKKQLDEARELLVSAERELESALLDLQHAERADKRMVSERISVAFSVLKKARTRLDALTAV